MEKLDIKNIFFDDVGKLFDDSLNQATQKSDIDVKDIWKKLEAKYEKIIDDFDKTLIDFYISKNKFSLKTFLSNHQKNQETIVSLNSNTFKSFIIYINCCHIIYEKTYENIEQKSVSENLKLCITIYGIVVRKAEQIVIR